MCKLYILFCSSTVFLFILWSFNNTLKFHSWKHVSARCWNPHCTVPYETCEHQSYARRDYVALKSKLMLLWLKIWGWTRQGERTAVVEADRVDVPGIPDWTTETLILCFWRESSGLHHIQEESQLLSKLSRQDLSWLMTHISQRQQGKQIHVTERNLQCLSLLLI